MDVLEAQNMVDREETALSGYQLLAFRWVWGALVMGALILFAISLPLYFTHLLKACTSLSDPLCTLHGTLTTSGMRALQSLKITPATYATYTIVLSIIGACIWSGIGLWIFWRRSDDGMALFVSAFLLLYSTNIAAGPTSILRTISPALNMVVLLMSLAASCTLGLFFLLFPDGRFTPRWTRWIAVGYILLQIGTLFPPFTSFFSASVQSSWLTNVIFVGLLGLMVFAQLKRYQQMKHALQRQQTKWVIFGSIVTIVGLLAADVPYLFWHALAQSGTLEIALNTVFYVVTLPIPLSIGIAMARYRLYDIDVLINRTLVYGTLTGLLALIYVGLVLALQFVFQPLTSGSTFIVVISTLAIAALFQPLRGLVQRLINRRFYRSRYDAGHILAAFSIAIRRELDLQLLHQQLVTVVEQTFQPVHAALHLAKEVQDRSDPLLDYLSRQLDTIELHQLPASSSTVQALRAAHTSLVVPLVSQNELIGWLSLGPRRSGQGYTQDDRRLLTTLALQIAPTIQVAQYAQERQATALEQERVEQELRVARRIQHSLLPKELPTLSGWQLAAYYQPAREVGGDFYDFFPFPDGRLGLVIGDVSGKGVPAALVMATTHSLLHAVVNADRSPGWVLGQLNTLLQPDLPLGTFVTCFYAILNPETGHLHFANAGHDLPLRHIQGCARELEARGMPLGLMPDMEYEEQEAALEADEGIVFYSDGLVEAHSTTREMFGFPRMMQLLSRQDGATDIIHFFLEQLHVFTGPAWAQEDDITLVTLQKARIDDVEHMC